TGQARKSREGARESKTLTTKFTLRLRSVQASNHEGKARRKFLRPEKNLADSSTEEIMESHEIQEQAEHAHHAGEKGIGLTTAIVAVLLAVATLLSHRSHTEEIKLQTQTNDQWG